MIQINQSGVLASLSVGAAEEFIETGCLLLPAFLAPPVLRALQKKVETAEFVTKNELHKDRVFGTTQFVPWSDPLTSTVLFLLNGQKLFEAVQAAARCPVLHDFSGRVHRTRAAKNEEAIDWHGDATDSRAVGLSLNLGGEEVSGGLFQIRGPDRRIRAEMRHAKAGDAFLFKIGCGWQHRLTPLDSGNRTVAVGWFRTAPRWREWTREQFELRVKERSTHG